MEVIINIYYDHKTSNLKMFKTTTKIWLDRRASKKRIIFSHHLKLYAKNFDCTRDELKKLILTANRKIKNNKWW